MRIGHHPDLVELGQHLLLDSCTRYLLVLPKVLLKELLLLLLLLQLLLLQLLLLLHLHAHRRVTRLRNLTEGLHELMLWGLHLLLWRLHLLRRGLHLTMEPSRHHHLRGLSRKKLLRHRLHHGLDLGGTRRRRRGRRRERVRRGLMTMRLRNRQRITVHT